MSATQISLWRWNRLKSLLPVFLAVVFNLSSGGPAHANLVINPIFDSTITSDPNAAVIENTISNVIAYYQASFADNITVYIDFHKVTNGLGRSSTYYNSISFSSFRSHLVSSASTYNDALALAHLPNTTTNPVAGGITNNLTLPNGRAIGFAGNTSDGLGHTVNWDSSAANPDGDVYLNISLMNLARTNINGSKYDLYAVVAHEIDEVLGLGSALNDVYGGPFPSGYASVMDYFRYDQNGSRIFSTNSAVQSYFSLDGTNRLVRFNQAYGGDFQDWYSPGGQTPRIQDAFATAGATPNPSVELIALDVIGYDFLVPSIAIAKAGTGKETISWSPNTPGFFLQENTNLMTTNWLNSTSSTNNPATVTNTVARKFYRVFHP